MRPYRSLFANKRGDAQSTLLAKTPKRDTGAGGDQVVFTKSAKGLTLASLACIFVLDCPYLAKAPSRSPLIVGYCLPRVFHVLQLHAHLTWCAKCRRNFIQISRSCQTSHHSHTTLYIWHFRVIENWVCIVFIPLIRCFSFPLMKTKHNILLTILFTRCNKKTYLNKIFYIEMYCY